MWTRRFSENVNIWCLVLALRLNLSQAVACLVSLNVRKSEYLWVWSIVAGADLSLAAALIIWRDPELWLAGGTKRYFSQIEDCEALSDLTLGILLKYPFCFDLSFDWNCPERIACDQNMPHQFLSNHWRYFDREDCFLTKAINPKQQRWIIRVINLTLISENPKKPFYWEPGRLKPDNRHIV